MTVTHENGPQEDMKSSAGPPGGRTSRLGAAGPGKPHVTDADVQAEGRPHVADDPHQTSAPKNGSWSMDE